MEQCTWYSYKIPQTCILFSTCPEIDEENTDFSSNQVGCQIAKRSKKFLFCHSFLNISVILNVSCYSITDKLIVTTGFNNLTSPDFPKTTEVIDMDDPLNICSNLFDFPVGQFGTSGVGLVDNQWPFLVCGGCAEDSELNKNCYSFGFNPFPVAKLSESRCLASSIVFNTTTTWITGGLNSNSVVERPILSSTELVSITGMTEMGPDLPTPLNGHCSIKISDSNVFIIGGRNSTDQSDNGLKSTIYYDLAQKTWSDGPKMTQARSAFGCGAFFSEYHNGKRVIAAIGKMIKILEF